MRDEAEKSRQHELEMAKLLLNATAPVSQQQGTGDQIPYWQQYRHVPPSFEHHVPPTSQHHQQIPPAFQTPPFSIPVFSPPPTTQPLIDPTDNSPLNVPKHYHTL